MTYKEEKIQRYKENIELSQSQIDNHKKCLLNAEYDIKIWRVFKMVDELFLWYEITQNFALYEKQYNRLKDIQNKLKEQYNRN